MDVNSIRRIIATSVESLKARVEEVNRLNVFPVPDGDTGTNMSLTLEAVLKDVSALENSATLEDVCKAATHGSLMGARGNSGVITSQIIRGLCEGLLEAQGQSGSEVLARALETAKVVSYQAVRKPVEGTILTVISDMALAARAGADEGIPFEILIEQVVEESYASVRRTPNLLPVLKEAGVVDAGGFGLAIAFDGFVAALMGRSTIEVEVPVVETGTRSSEMSVVPYDDWDDDEFLYCTEFLLFGEGIDRESFHDFIASVGGSELIVGDGGEYKVHVHTNDPSQVLQEALALGEIAEVHIHNMRRQQAERPGSTSEVARKALAIVAVSTGSGNEEIFKSLGVDVVVSGGQTMNPSTADLVDAARSVPADSYLFLPNNSNIILAAQAATEVLEEPSAVIQTRSIPEGFSALFAYIPDADFESLIEDMTEAAGEVKTAEITVAVKNAKGKVGDIKAGQLIGITNGKEIEVAGEDLTQVTIEVIQKLAGSLDETVTLIYGEDIKDEAGEAIQSAVAEAFPTLEVEVHRGEQPLYPILLAVE